MESKNTVLLLVTVLCFINVTLGLNEPFRLEDMPKVTELIGECISEIGLSDDDIVELLQKKSPESRKQKCAVFCVMRKLELTQDGRVDRNGMLAVFDAVKEKDSSTYEKLGDIGEKCQSEMASDPETDECELAVKASDCIYRVGIQMGLRDDQLFV